MAWVLALNLDALRQLHSLGCQLLVQFSGQFRHVLHLVGLSAPWRLDLVESNRQGAAAPESGRSHLQAGLFQLLGQPVHGGQELVELFPARKVRIHGGGPALVDLMLQADELCPLALRVG